FALRTKRRKFHVTAGSIHVSGAFALRTRFRWRVGIRTLSVAGAARHTAGDSDFRGNAAHRVHQSNVDGIKNVVSAKRADRCRAAPASARPFLSAANRSEEIGKNIGKRISSRVREIEPLKIKSRILTTGPGLPAFSQKRSVLIILGAFLGIGKDRVGLRQS